MKQLLIKTCNILLNTVAVVCVTIFLLIMLEELYLIVY
jgi:hypothetical protein